MSSSRFDACIGAEYLISEDYPNANSYFTCANESPAV